MPYLEAVGLVSSFDFASILKECISFLVLLLSRKGIEANVRLLLSSLFV